MTCVVPKKSGGRPTVQKYWMLLWNMRDDTGNLSVAMTLKPTPVFTHPGVVCIYVHPRLGHLCRPVDFTRQLLPWTVQQFININFRPALRTRRKVLRRRAPQDFGSEQLVRYRRKTTTVQRRDNNIINTDDPSLGDIRQKQPTTEMTTVAAKTRRTRSYCAVERCAKHQHIIIII